MNNIIERARKLWRLNVDAIVQNRERRLAQYIGSDSWETFPSAVFKEISPVFFLSTGRCGTELITRLIRGTRGKSAVVYHSPVPELVYADRLAYELSAFTARELELAFIAARFEKVADAFLRNRVYVETNFRVTFFARAISNVFPKARFVHLYRSPIGFAKSAARLGYYEGRYTDIARIRPLHHPYIDEWYGWSPIERGAWLWNETNSWIEGFKNDVNGVDLMSVKFEELVASPSLAIKMIEFCGLEGPSYKRTRDILKRRVNEKRSAAKMQELAHEDISRIREIAPLAEYYGY